MAQAAIDLKQEAHELINSLAPGQLAAVVGLLKVMADPETRRLASIPFDDEPVSEEENRAVAEAKAWLETHEPISNEEVLAEYGLTAEDFERMGRTPLDEPFVPGQ